MKPVTNTTGYSVVGEILEGLRPHGVGDVCRHLNAIAYTEDGERFHGCRDCGEVFPVNGPRDTDDGLEMHDNSCGECGHPYKQGDETHYPECSRLQGNQQPEPEPAGENQWTAGRFDDVLDGYPVLSPEGLAAIATDPEYQKLIVTAVNNHAALVAALEQFVSIYPPNARRHPDVAVAISNAETALARVHGNEDRY